MSPGLTAKDLEAEAVPVEDFRNHFDYVVKNHRVDS